MPADLKDEIARYRELLRRDPRSRVFAPLAEACRREGRLEEALALARTGVANHPAYAGGRMALGRVLLDLGQVREAAEEIERAVGATPGCAPAWRLLGEARARLRDRSGAFEAFARALALDPLDTAARDAVLDIDSLMGLSPPEQEAAAPIAAEELDLSLEVIEEGKAPAGGLSGLERAWLEEGELSLLLIPEENGTEEEWREAPTLPEPLADATAFLAGRLEILDIVHSSLAPEAMEEPAIDGPQVPREARAELDTPLVSGPETVWEFPEGDAEGAPLPGPPDPERRPEQEREADEPLAVPPDLRTETLADLYVQQGHVDRAREIYRAILAENPLHLRVKKKLFELSPPVPPAGESAAERKVAALGRWLDRARSAAQRPRSEGAGRRPGIEDPPRNVTTTPRSEGR